MPFDRAEFDQTLANARERLLAARNAAGHWEGELSSMPSPPRRRFLPCTRWSPRSKAKLATRDLVTRAGRLIREGLAWLALHQNADGGWGIRPEVSATSARRRSAGRHSWRKRTGRRGRTRRRFGRSSSGCVHARGSLAPRCARMRSPTGTGWTGTFSVPILTMMALAGRLGPGAEAWDLVPALPFELAAFPQRWFKWLKLPVVSYALPALIAIGQVRHVCGRAGVSPCASVRTITRGRTLRLLRANSADERRLPGGDAADELRRDEPRRRGAGRSRGRAARGQFLVRSVRRTAPGRSTPTSRRGSPRCRSTHSPTTRFPPGRPARDRAKVREWLLSQQYRTEHPYTLADPGRLGVDRPARRRPRRRRHPGRAARPAITWATSTTAPAPPPRPASAGCWDSRTPTAASPPSAAAGASSPSTAAAPTSPPIPSAWQAWADDLPASLARAPKSASRAHGYLATVQAPDGHWSPLWFGNQHRREEDNPTYGTSRILRAAGDLHAGPGEMTPRDRLAAQRPESRRRLGRWPGDAFDDRRDGASQSNPWQTCRRTVPQPFPGDCPPIFLKVGAAISAASPG